MSLRNYVAYTNVTVTNATVLTATLSNILHGYSLKTGATALQLDITDAGTSIISINAAANTSDTKIFPVGVRCAGIVGVTGTATNLGYVTLFYEKETV